MNDKKGRRNCGAEGIDKSVIDKRKSLRNEQSLTDARKTHLLITSQCSSQIPINKHTHTHTHTHTKTNTNTHTHTYTHTQTNTHTHKHTYTHTHTVWMKSVTMFSGALRLLRHYKSNLAHLLEFKNLVIEFLNG